MYLDRVSITAWSVTLVLVASGVVALPGRGAAVLVGTQSIVLPFGAASLVPMLLAALAGTGTHAVVQAHPLARPGLSRPPGMDTRGLGITVRYWALPIAVSLIAWQILPLAPSSLYWGAGLLLFAVLFSSVLVGVYFSLDPFATGYRRARAGLNLIGYLTALLLFLLMPEEWSGLQRSLLPGAVAFLLAMELLRGTQVRGWLVALHATVVGAVVAEVAWALALAGISPLTAGMLLLLLFYLMVGLAWHSLLQRLTRRVVLEFAGVSLVALVLIVWLGP